LCVHQPCRLPRHSGEKKLVEGDIVNIDVTVILDGWHGDTSRMYLVGDKIPVKALRLVDITHKAMMAGIGVVRPGARLGDVGAAIQAVAEPNASPSSGISAGMESERFFTPSRPLCIMESLVRGWSCARGCFLRSNP
jgi:methionine aminopeptidase